MTAPRLEIDLNKIDHNARTLVKRLASRGIAVTGVTKATLGSPEIAATLLQAGVRAIGDSRIENVEAIRRADPATPTILIRAPMLSQVDRVVTHADVSCNTELRVIRRLSAAATRLGRIHGIVVMVELGDLREGIMPADLEALVRETVLLPNIEFKGIGTNLACRSGVCPDDRNMAELSALADSIEANLSLTCDIVSGGNSANLNWALSGRDAGRINDLRLGESILLGRESLRRQPIDGLHTDAITLVAEVIESKIKPSQRWGETAQSAFEDQAGAFGAGSDSTERDCTAQTILAIGQQDTDPHGLRPHPGVTILAASSDHLIVDARNSVLPIGTELTFQLNYSALVRAMTSPYVARFMNPIRGVPDAVPLPLICSHRQS